MNCPNCGAPEQARVEVCRSCGQTYPSQDLLELRQLEFLLKETATWEVAEARRAPYAARLKTLLAGLRQPEAAMESRMAAERLKPAAPVAPKPAAVTPPPQPAPPPAPPEHVPFDQWLLSERNIKLALYAGGLLLVLAGLIFVAANWTRIPGPGKFAIILMITGLTYLGGYLLFQRPTLRLGGVALLGVASGFLALNFVVLQIYVLGPAGLRPDLMWLIASPLCLLLYLLTAYWTRSDLFVYLGLAGAGSTVTAALVVSQAPLLAFIPAYALLALTTLLLARALRSTWPADFTYMPLVLVSNLTMPLIIVAALVGWVFETGCANCPQGSPWLVLLALGAGILFYVTTDAAFTWLAGRWTAAVLVPATCSLALIELDFSASAAGILLMVLAFAQLSLGYALEQGQRRRAGGLPLYITAYAVAIYVTLLALPETTDLIKALLGDVILLAVSAAIFRDYRWIYGAAWLFLLPVYLFIDLYTPVLTYQGLLMGVLGLNYTVAGYVLGRRTLRLGGPFLTAAVFLGVVAVALAWGSPTVASLMLGVIAALYLMVALWLDWPWLLLPGLLAVNLAVFTVAGIFLDNFASLRLAVIIAFAAVGVVSALGGYGLRQAGSERWTWPLYLVGAIDLAGAYQVGLLLTWLSPEDVHRALAVGLSTVVAVMLLAFAWLERAAFVKYKSPPLLTYLGLVAVFVGHFYLLGAAGQSVTAVWPAYTAGLCGLFVALSWLLQRKPLAEFYGVPLRLAGLGLMIIPLVGSLVIFKPELGAVTFALAGVIGGTDAALRRNLLLAYLSTGAIVVVIWAVLLALNVSELQAYVIPFGLVLLGIGWNECRCSRVVVYRLLTLLGLIALMGSAFIQSLPSGAFIYAVLLGFESLVALGWGSWTHSRGYVQVGALALITNAIAQLGPGFIELPRWVQIGITGGILFGVGLGALFKREQLLVARRAFEEEWRQWQP